MLATPSPQRHFYEVLRPVGRRVVPVVAHLQESIIVFLGFHCVLLYVAVCVALCCCSFLSAQGVPCRLYFDVEFPRAFNRHIDDLQTDVMVRHTRVPFSSLWSPW